MEFEKYAIMSGFCRSGHIYYMTRWVKTHFFRTFFNIFFVSVIYGKKGVDCWSFNLLSYSMVVVYIGIMKVWDF